MDDDEEYYTEIMKRKPGGPDSIDSTYFEKNW